MLDGIIEIEYTDPVLEEIMENIAGAIKDNDRFELKYNHVRLDIYRELHAEEWQKPTLTMYSNAIQRYLKNDFYSENIR